MSVISITRGFHHRFPGPFAYCDGRAGVDNTFDVFCRTTDTHLLSTYYWEEQQRAQLEARVACLAFSAPAFGYRTKGIESVLKAFLELYPTPYSARRLFCEYFGPSFEVLSKSDDQTVFILPDHIRKNGLISQHLAASLNELFEHFTESDRVLDSSALTLTA